MSRSTAARWTGLALATLAGTLVGEALGVPTPSMLVGLLVGLVYAVRSPVRLEITGRPKLTAQMVTGSVVGAYVSLETLKGIGSAWLPVMAIVIATLVLTFLAGLLLARITDLTPATATFGMIAGGAAGIVAIADDLGADNRMVAVMQYLRVFMILALTPVIAGLAFDPQAPGSGGEALASQGDQITTLQGILFVLVCGPLGVALATRLRMTSPTFFGPMLIGAVLTVAGAPFAGAMPNLLPYIAYAVIGLQVGLEFTPAVLRQAARILPQVLGVLVLMLAVCAGLGLAMAPLAGVSALDGYLATTPGVLQVVLGTAIGMHANTTFVLSAQVLRLLMMLLAAPAVARRFVPMDQPKMPVPQPGAVS